MKVTTVSSLVITLTTIVQAMDNEKRGFFGDLFAGIGGNDDSAATTAAANQETTTDQEVSQVNIAANVAIQQGNLSTTVTLSDLLTSI